MLLLEKNRQTGTKHMTLIYIFATLSYSPGHQPWNERVFDDLLIFLAIQCMGMNSGTLCVLFFGYF